MANDFDSAAKNYDANFTYSKIGLAQRKIVYSNLKNIFQSKTTLNILELNCGTGYDAINFAKAGHNVVATDISEGMIKVAKSKTNNENISFQTLDINTISNKTLKTKFDIIFSNFGGFNCLTKDEIDSFLKKATKLLKPQGKITLVIMPKHCVWERLYFTLKGKLKKAKRRHTNTNVIAYVDGISVKTWYYNPNQIETLAKIHFDTIKVKPVGLSIPPSYLEHSIVANKLLLGLFKRIDAIFTASRLAKYADHYLIELQLK